MSSKFDNKVVVAMHAARGVGKAIALGLSGEWAEHIIDVLEAVKEVETLLIGGPTSRLGYWISRQSSRCHISWIMRVNSGGVVNNEEVC